MRRLKSRAWVRLIASETHGRGSLSSVGDDRPTGSELLTVPSYVEVTVKFKDDRERKAVWEA